ncbi:MAG TPA: hypothetical protein VGO47_14990 [Chlamydiales bacterium]|jgi:hypothetical protein|nr:hypothetical protein [Chlamydiales bacterium]
MILPRLYGIQSLLQESNPTTRLSIHGLQELYSISSAIEQLKLGHTDDIKTQDMMARKRLRSNDNDASQETSRRVLLPPSPERSQKRKPSKSIF